MSPLITLPRDSDKVCGLLYECVLQTPIPQCEGAGKLPFSSTALNSFVSGLYSWRKIESVTMNKSLTNLTRFL